MSSQYAGDDMAFPVDFTIPDDGDAVTAAAVNVALEALGDRTALLKRESDSTVRARVMNWPYASPAGYFNSATNAAHTLAWSPFHLAWVVAGKTDTTHVYVQSSPDLVRWGAMAGPLAGVTSTEGPGALVCSPTADLQVAVDGKYVSGGDTTVWVNTGFATTTFGATSAAMAASAGCYFNGLFLFFGAGHMTLAAHAPDDGLVMSTATAADSAACSFQVIRSGIGLDGAGEPIPWLCAVGASATMGAAQAVMAISQKAGTAIPMVYTLDGASFVQDTIADFAAGEIVHSLAYDALRDVFVVSVGNPTAETCKVFTTRNLGASWDLASTITGNSLRALGCDANGTWVASGANQVGNIAGACVYYSRDAGAHWYIAPVWCDSASSSYGRYSALGGLSQRRSVLCNGSRFALSSCAGQIFGSLDQGTEYGELT